MPTRDPEKKRAQRKKWRDANPEKAKAARERWLAKSVDRVEKQRGYSEAWRRRQGIQPRDSIQRKGPLTDVDDPRHGTVNGYNNLGCRCDRCRKAWADVCRERARRRREAHQP